MVLLRHAQLAALTGFCLWGLCVLPASAADADAATEALSLTSGAIAGEILDTAVEHCRRGERAQAMSMFAAIREQLAPPPALLQLVLDLEASGCTPQLEAQVRAFKLLAGGGYDSNVSQGISARSLTLGSGDDTLELPLDDSYRPRGSSFAQLAADYSVPLAAPGWALLLGAGARAHQQTTQFDIASGSVSLSKVGVLNGRTLRGQLDASELWLGGRRYQRVVGATLQTVLDLDADGAWIAHASASMVDYHFQPSQNASHYEAGISRDKRLGPATTLYANFALQHDASRGTRPGGDRNGWQFTAGALKTWDGWRFKPQLTLQQWVSSEVFAAGLIDRRRNNQSVQFALQAERPLGPRQTLVLEWRSRSVRDTVALYQYKAQSLGAFIQQQF